MSPSGTAFIVASLDCSIGSRTLTASVIRFGFTCSVSVSVSVCVSVSLSLSVCRHRQSCSEKRRFQTCDKANKRLSRSEIKSECGSVNVKRFLTDRDVQT